MDSLDKEESCGSQKYDGIEENNGRNDEDEVGNCVLTNTTSSNFFESDASSSHEKDENEIQERVHVTRRTRSFPPPLPCLAKSHSQFPHGMPLVLLQPFRRNGRFVLQEVKVAPPVMFHPIRRDGRFVLQLIRQDDDYYPVHETEPKLRETTGKTSTTGVSEVVEETEVGGEKHLQSKILDAIDKTPLQGPLAEETGSDEIQIPSADCTVTSGDSEARNMDSKFCTEASSDLQSEDVSTSDQQDKVVGSTQRLTMKPPFEGRCFPRERGLDWHLANLHVTSVSM